MRCWVFRESGDAGVVRVFVENATKKGLRGAPKGAVILMPYRLLGVVGSELLLVAFGGQGDTRQAL